MIDASNSKSIAIIPSVSYGMATVARNLGIKPGEKIIVAAEQFPSNYFPWQRIAQENGAEVIVVAPMRKLGEVGKIDLPYQAKKITFMQIAKL